MTVCPTSGSQIEGDNLFEYRTFAMEDDGLDRRHAQHGRRGLHHREGIGMDAVYRDRLEGEKYMLTLNLEGYKIVPIRGDLGRSRDPVAGIPLVPKWRIDICRRTDKPEVHRTVRAV
ncbi:hypothetical protein PCH_Pc15g00920 [Penicillium rubens Wisconsin 54-1255]|uniref:Uncharacterized protein n=1 Tax=Penicillium rubens (strain ATCC 28089 / DSM 1075 / NRRL 1951 / Wisconsin 54-1255) TaxID=500485 RepID=B6H6N6_PENRW|nr:hypothetical protein PCH_Pc15g00920 [Penicillium rubens Wisconsin 54-1255]